MKFIRRLCVAMFVPFLASCVVQKNANVLPQAPQNGSAARSPGFENEQLWEPPNANHWEPVVAADPRTDSSWVYQLTTDQRPDYLLFRASNDRGDTWQAPRHICRRGVNVPFQYDPQIAVGTSGIVDIVCLDGFNPGVVFSQSRDHGRTWSKSIRLDGTLRYSDKPTLAISRDGANVYVAYNAFYALYVTTSHDYGRTWTAPVKATASHYWYYSYGGTVAPNGAVWFAVDGETGKDETGDGHVELVTSADGGTTWREIPFVTSHEGAACTMKRCYPDFYTAQDAIAADSLGNLVFVFAENHRKQGPNALYVSRSNDGGSNWTRPALINDRGNSTSPAIVSAAANDFRLVWQDNRYGRNAWNTWYAQSTDGGDSWSRALRLSNLGSVAPYKHPNGYEFPLGDYLGLAVDARGVNYVIWGEGADIYFPGGTWWTRGTLRP